MVLQSIDNGGSTMASGSRGKCSKDDELQGVLGFLKTYKPIECDCCEEVLAYVERKTGRLLCNPSCTPGDKLTTMQKMALQCNSGYLNNPQNPRGLNGNVAGNSMYETIMGKSSKLEMHHGIGLEGSDFVDGQARPSTSPPPQKTEQLMKNGPSNSNHIPTLKSKSSSEVSSSSSSPGTPKSKAGDVPPSPSPECVVPRSSSGMLVKLEEQSKTTEAPLKPGESLRKEGNPFIKSISPKGSGSAKGLWNQQPSQIKKPVQVAETRKNILSNMKYSPNLKDGAAVKITYMYKLAKYQVSAVADDDTQEVVQDAVSAYVAKHPEKTYAKIGRVPVVNEIVIGKYQGEDFFRGRVMKVGEKDCKILFLDYGDMEKNTFDDIYEPNDELLQYPIMSITVKLHEVPATAKLESGSKEMLEINRRVADSVILQLYEDFKVKDNEEFEATIWYDDENSLNASILAAL